jgi:asparagine synthase (glutamine-hydrolysing)
MESACGRYVITYNGELYNTANLRHALLQKGIALRGSSDTELLVNSISIWGIDVTLHKINGIFAFGLWDKKERRLSLVRDPIGVKPLYFSSSSSRTIFASELRALSVFPDFDAALDRNAVGAFLQNNFIPSPLTIYSQVESLPPGTIAEIDSTGQLSHRCYWDIREVASRAAPARRRQISEKDAIETLHTLLRQIVRDQLVSDVPVGVFLSGGIDSSLMASLMRECSNGPVHSFSIGFEDPVLNEAVHAEKVAQHLGTSHSSIYVDDQEVLSEIQNLPNIYDQPLADISLIPMHLLSRHTAATVKVALSGDGGDEFFFGYDRFFKGDRVYQLASALPGIVRQGAANLLDGLGAEAFRRDGFQRTGKVARMLWHMTQLVHYGKSEPRNIYRHFVTHWPEAESMIGDFTRNDDRWSHNVAAAESFADFMMLHEMTGFMTDQVLAKVDRASMAASLEVRVPLLDTRLIEHAWELPISFKYRSGQGKWCLRQILYRYVPSGIVDRPKAGFRPPLGQWLRGPLREWAEHHLSEAALARFGLLNPAPSRALWMAHLSGRVDASDKLWTLLTLQSWLEHNASRTAL